MTSAKIAKAVKKLERDGVIQAHIACIRMILYHYDNQVKPYHTLSAFVEDMGWSVDVLKAVVSGQPLPRRVYYKEKGRWRSRKVGAIRLATRMATDK